MSRPRQSRGELLSAFPHLTHGEFEWAIEMLSQKYHQGGHGSNEWISTDVVTQNETFYLSIAKSLPRGAALTSEEDETNDEVEEDTDDETLCCPTQGQPIIHYDVVLSPSYRVPVLYISISDTQQRYPPTMEVLKEHIIPPQFQAETESVGIIGGVTITEHPATNKPVFFVHPCQTAEVMEAVAGNRRLTADEYLVIWLGAFGKCVGLDVPMALARHMDLTGRDVD